LSDPLENNQHKTAGGVAQVLRAPTYSKHKALSSSPSIAKKKKKTPKKQQHRKNGKKNQAFFNLLLDSGHYSPLSNFWKLFLK
jgi:hypothetical protein